MQKSLQKYELSPSKARPADLMQSFDASRSYGNQSQLAESMKTLTLQPPTSYQQVRNLPEFTSYQQEEQKVKMIQLHCQPQLKTTLVNSNYMRQLREQSLQQIQNWDNVILDNQDRLKKQEDQKINAESGKSMKPIVTRF